MSEDWCCTQLANLKIKGNRLSILQQIRGRLHETPNLEANLINRLLSAPELYDCFTAPDSSGNEQVDVASDILSICMSNLSITQSDLPRLLHRALTHPCSRIKSLALGTILKELQQHVNDEGTVTETVSDDLLTYVLESLQHNDPEVAVPALNILKLVLEPHLVTKRVQDYLMHMLTGNEVVKCRVYELAVNLALMSSATLGKVEKLLDSALAELDNNDVLVQVTILEILTPLAEKNHALLYLEKRQVFEILSRRIESLEENSIDRLIVPGVMKFFGKIAYNQPQKIIMGYPTMLQCLFDCLLVDFQATLLPVAFDTFANIAGTDEGKLLLYKHYSEPTTKIFQQYATYLRNLSTDMRNRAFNSLEFIFHNDGPQKPNITEILHSWFVILADGQNMQFLMDYCKNPFPDIKVACLHFVKAVCHYEWGLKALRDTGGFLEYLMDRKVEFDKEVKYAKYEVLVLMADSDVFDMQTQLQLRTYVNQGAYFVDTTMDVAVEGN